MYEANPALRHAMELFGYQWGVILVKGCALVTLSVTVVAARRSHVFPRRGWIFFASALFAENVLYAYIVIESFLVQS